MSDQQHQGFPGQPAYQQPHAPGIPHTAHPAPVRPPGGAPAGGARFGSAVVPPQAHPPTDKDLEPISLIEEPHPVAAPAHAPVYAHAPVPPPKKIQAFGAVETAHKKRDWKRPLAKSGHGASRVRSFHGKYSEQGLDYLDNAINDWLDANPDVEIKFVTPTVMTFEGKIREPALVLNLWY